MTTQPTPELAKYREEFESITAATPMLSLLLYQKNDDGKYRNHAVESEWQGYLRRCQETEQAMKEFKLQLTLLLDSSDYYAVENIDQYHIEADAMKGLLK